MRTLDVHEFRDAARVVGLHLRRFGTCGPVAEKEMQMIFNVRTLAAIGAATLLGTGCSTPAPQPPAAEPAPAEQAVPTPAKPEVSINAVMVALVDHAGHALWDAERQGKAPKTDAQWDVIEEHAVQLAAAGSAITVGGTGPSDAVWVKSPDWRSHAQKMSDAGVAAMNAAKAKNLDALVAANSQLVESCESCHKQFKPELPTEGITHSHAH